MCNEERDKNVREISHYRFDSISLFFIWPTTHETKQTWMFRKFKIIGFNFHFNGNNIFPPTLLVMPSVYSSLVMNSSKTLFRTFRITLEAIVNIFWLLYILYIKLNMEESKYSLWLFNIYLLHNRPIVYVCRIHCETY